MGSLNAYGGRSKRSGQVEPQNARLAPLGRNDDRVARCRPSYHSDQVGSLYWTLVDEGVRALRRTLRRHSIRGREPRRGRVVVCDASHWAPRPTSARRGVSTSRVEVERVLIVTPQPSDALGRPLLCHNPRIAAALGLRLRRLDKTLTRTVMDLHDRSVEYELPVTSHPSTSGVIVVNCPGAGESKDGYQERYLKIGAGLQARNTASLVTYNPPRPDTQHLHPREPYWYHGASWNRISVEGMTHVIDDALENAEALCGRPNPTVHLSGFSAGGSVCGAVAHRYPQVERLLLISAYDSVAEYFYEGIKGFRGEIFLTYGTLDTIAGGLAYFLQFLVQSMKALHVRAVPDCDHGFRGARNSRVLSKAFSWAFEGDDSYPSPNGAASFTSRPRLHRRCSTSCVFVPPERVRRSRTRFQILTQVNTDGSVGQQRISVGLRMG